MEIITIKASLYFGQQIANAGGIYDLFLLVS